MTRAVNVEEHRYGTRSDQVLSLYRPSSTSRVPLVVAVHGGAWRTGDRSLMHSTADALAQRGCTVASIEYRQRQPDPVDDMVDDIRSASNWARSGPGGAGVVLLGDSAGAHAALLGVLSGGIPHPFGVVSLCGALDLSVLDAPGNDDERIRFAEYRNTLSGGGAHTDLEALDPCVFREASGRDIRMPPLFASTSSYDFFQRSTLGYVRTAIKLGDDVTLHHVGAAHPECRHSWQLDASLTESTRLFDAVTGWLRTLRVPEPRRPPGPESRTSDHEGRK